MLRRVAGSACVVVLSIAAAGVLHAGRPQQPPRHTERVDVSSVVVDARVVDEVGAPVLGLRASDFSVAIGGRPVRVQTAVWTGGAAAPAPVQAPGSIQPCTDAEGEGQLIVLLFQKSLARGRARGFMRMVEQSRSLVRGLQPSDRVAIVQFGASLRVWTDFTADRDALDRILARGILHEQPPASVSAGAPPVLRGLVPAGRRDRSVEGALESMAEALRPLPRSKAIVFVGYGFGSTPFGARPDVGPTAARFGTDEADRGGSGGASTRYQRARRALTAARVSVFSLDVTEADAHSLAAGMQVVAADTGGFYASSIDFPERPMRFVMGALTGHYVLFVEPSEQPGDRTIAVSVASDRRAYVYSTSSY